MQGRSLARIAFAVICIGGTALGLNNTYGDNSELKALAQKTACGAPGCSISELRESRSALTQAFSFQTALVEKGKSSRGASVDVECQRKQYLFGEYQCAVTSGGIPGVVGGPAPAASAH